MNTISATYFDGRTSQPSEVTLTFGEGGAVRVRGANIDRIVSRAKLRIESRLGDTPRFLRLSEGGHFVTSDNDGIDAALADWKSEYGARFIHRLESSWRLALGAVLVMSIVAWFTIRYGIPAAAKQVAYNLPASVTEHLGQDALRVLDSVVFEPSGLSEERQEEIRISFDEFLDRQDDTYPYQLQFRAAPKLGANAMALPSGAIVMTDELVALAEDDRELLGVLAHECGHINGRHSLRAVLQNSAVIVVIAMATGDVSTVTALGGAIPTVLLQTKFSRLFEEDADGYAVVAMEKAGVDPRYLATILQRLSENMKTLDSEFLDYLSTHPATEDRLKSIEVDEP